MGERREEELKKELKDSVEGLRSARRKMDELEDQLPWKQKSIRNLKAELECEWCDVHNKDNIPSMIRKLEEEEREIKEELEVAHKRYTAIHVTIRELERELGFHEEYSSAREVVWSANRRAEERMARMEMLRVPGLDAIGVEPQLKPPTEWTLPEVPEERLHLPWPEPDPHWRSPEPLKASSSKQMGDSSADSPCYYDDDVELILKDEESELTLKEEDSGKDGGNSESESEPTLKEEDSGKEGGNSESESDDSGKEEQEEETEEGGKEKPDSQSDSDSEEGEESE